MELEEAEDRAEACEDMEERVEQPLMKDQGEKPLVEELVDGNPTVPETQSPPQIDETEEMTERDKENSTTNIRGRSGGLQLPLARVRCIMKSDPDITLASQEAVFLIAKVTELFAGHMAKTAYQYTVQSKRKTVQKKDLDSCLVHHDEMSFLEGMLDS